MDEYEINEFIVYVNIDGKWEFAAKLESTHSFGLAPFENNDGLYDVYLNGKFYGQAEVKGRCSWL